VAAVASAATVKATASKSSVVSETNKNTFTIVCQT
jgi:hypothetical protein